MPADLVTPLLIALLVSLCVGALSYVVFYSRVSGTARTEQRFEKIVSSEAKRRSEVTRSELNERRRRQIEESLKEIEGRQRSLLMHPPLNVRLEQAGLKGWRRGFYVLSFLSGVLGFGAMMLASSNIFIAIGIAAGAGIMLPRWFLAFMTHRRLKKFVNEFPNAVDIIVRGVKAGLPFADCVRICAQETEEPVKGEFRVLVEAQALGITMADAVEQLYHRVPLPEANFFATVVAIQQRSGGNLAEVLGNLSKMLRERKKMKHKIAAMSQEAKSSAGIIAALPVVVGTLVYFTSPAYISMMWTTPAGQLMLVGCVVWMSIGVFVIKKMVSFDF